MKNGPRSPRFMRSPGSSPKHSTTSAFGYDDSNSVYSSGTKGISSPKSNSGSVFDDANSTYGGQSVHGSVIGHDDPTAVMGNMKPESLHDTIKSVGTFGTISSFLTTEHERVTEIETRQPLAGIAEVGDDIRDQLDELDQAATAWVSRRSGLSECSSLYSGGSDVEDFYVNEAGTTVSSGHHRNNVKAAPETIGEEAEGMIPSPFEQKVEARNVPKPFSSRLDLALQGSRDDSRASAYFSSDQSQTSNEQPSMNSASINSQSINSDPSATGDKHAKPVQAGTITQSDDLRSGSSSGEESNTPEIIRQVQMLLLGPPDKEVKKEMAEPPLELHVDSSVDSSSVENSSDPCAVEEPRTPKSEQGFQFKAYMPVLDESKSQEEGAAGRNEGKSKPRRRVLFAAFLCLAIVALILTLLYFFTDLGEKFGRTTGNASTDTPLAELTMAPTLNPQVNERPETTAPVVPEPAPTKAPISSPQADSTIVLPDSTPTQAPVAATLPTFPPALPTIPPVSTQAPTIGVPPTFPPVSTQAPTIGVPPSFPPVSTQAPTIGVPPTAEPTQASWPTLNPAEIGVRFAGKARLMEISGDLLDDPTTPQYKAYQWLLNEDPADLDLDAISVKSLEQRYVAAVVYFSTNGAMWPYTFDFMTEGDVCQWNDSVTGKGIICDADGTIEEISINQNLLRGPLPSELQALTSLKRLEFRSNSITGSVPSELGKLSSLEELDLRQNRLTGTFPESIFELPSLKKLLMLRNGGLGGTIPDSIGKATSLEMVSFQRCQMSGSLPTSIGMLSNLFFFTLLGNVMTGVIPSELTQLPRLEVLELAENSFSGTIPGFAGQADLYFISLYENQLSGSLPETIGDLSGLLFFDVRFNVLSGTIPDSFNSVPELVTFHAAENQLTGSVPNFSGNVGLLQSIDLAGNKLSGNLEGLFAAGGPVGELHTIDLSSNSLTGTIPAAVGQFSRLAQLLMSDNELSGPIPSEVRDLNRLDTLLLFKNKLTGTVPEEVGFLWRLTHLDLSTNEFEGPITDTLGLLTDLSELDLSYNNFSGTLPESLVVLRSTLDEFYLQNNALTGDFDPVLCGAGEQIRNLVADCGEPNTEVTCSCCTACCNDATGCVFK